MLDFIGSMKMDPAILDEMREAGVEVQRYHKPRWWGLGRLNNRTHRKTLVIDGRLGFTGGVGIADDWRGNGRTRGLWRDLQYRVRGPAAAQMHNPACVIDCWQHVLDHGRTGRGDGGHVRSPERARPCDRP